jgi:hypothetical protein
MKKIIVAVAAFAMMATSAYAADWNFYGSATIFNFWTDTDIINPTAAQSAADDGYQVGMDNINSSNVIGANVKVSDELTARFEYGAGGADENVMLRHLYGKWNFGAGVLTIGRTDGAFDNSISNQVYGDDGIGDNGNADTGRADLIMLTFGGFSINIEAPVKAVIDGSLDAFGNLEAGDTGDAKLPQINASYKMNFDSVAVEVGGAYQTYEYSDAVGDIDSYVVGASVDGNFGAFHLAGNIFFGENVGNVIGADVSDDYGDGLALVAGNRVFDCDAFGYQLVAGYVVNDMFALEIGYGHVETDYDDIANSDNDSEAYYIQAPITLAPGVTVTPEIGMYDYNENQETEVTYFGAAWKIAF